MEHARRRADRARRPRSSISLGPGRPRATSSTATWCACPRPTPYYDFAYKANVETIRALARGRGPQRPPRRPQRHAQVQQPGPLHVHGHADRREHATAPTTTSGRSTSRRSTTRRGRPDATPPCCRGARPPRRAPATLADHAPAGARAVAAVDDPVAAGAAYLVVGFVLWVHAWADGASTHTLCGCGDPALFLWFFQWPATALAHGQNPFYSTALFHPTGVNLLAQTSVTGLSLPLVPVTWIWGPVASLNVASTAHARPHRLHRVRGDAALGVLDAGRLPGRVALRLLALRADQPRVRPPDDGRADAAAAHPGRPRRDPGPPAPQRRLGRSPPRAPGLRAVLPLLGVAGHHGPGRRALRCVAAGGRRPGGRPGRGCGGWRPMPPRGSPSAWPSAACCWPGRCGSRSRGRRISRAWCGPTSG